MKERAFEYVLKALFSTGEQCFLFYFDKIRAQCQFAYHLLWCGGINCEVGGIQARFGGINREVRGIPPNFGGIISEIGGIPSQPVGSFPLEIWKYKTIAPL